MEVSRRVVVNRQAKSMVAKSKGTRQALGGINTNILINKPSLKDKSLGSLKEKSSTGKPVKTTRKIQETCATKIEEEPEKEEETLETIAYSTTLLPANVDDIDSEHTDNPQLVYQYAKDIYQYLRILEAKFPVKKNYLEGSSEINGKMRAVLIDWLMQVHLKFHLLQETLYLTVQIIDRFLQVEKVRRTKLQLIGVTSMFIATKYEEMYAPEIGDLVYITDNTYNKEEILDMEQTILRKLDFSFGKPLPLHFLRRNSKAGNVNALTHTLAKYLMEVVLLEYELVHQSPSIVAAAALYLSIKLLENSPWTETLVYYSGYNESELLHLVSHICKLLIKAETSKLQSVHMKYASSKFMKISKCPELKSLLVKKLATGSL